MSISLETDADVDPAPTATRRVWIRWVLLAVVIAGIALIAFGVWLATGLKSAAAAIKTPATQARTDLSSMKTALQAGDQPAAKISLAEAHRNIAAADKAARRSPVRIAASLPLVSGAVADLDHLLTAAKRLVEGGDRVVALYEDVSGADSKLFRDSSFNLTAVRESSDSVQQLMTLLGQAEGELNQVRGARFADGAIEARDSALRQITQLRKDAQPLVNILAVLPAAVGAETKKCYLVTLQNQAELRPGGGAPLSLTEVCFDQGAMAIAPTAHTLDLDGNKAPFVWPAVQGNEAWHAPGKALRFAAANFAPDWPTSGEELLRAYEVVSGGSRPDGVIGIDVTAMAAVLAVTGGSITTTGYGTVTTDKLVQTILIDAYQKFDVATRHNYNSELMTAIVGRVVGGGQLTGKIRALTGTSPGRHMLMYFRDTALAQLINPTPMAGRLDPGTGDFAAMYTTNTNASKVDAYEARAVSHDVVVNADGTATVTRTMTLTNNSPGYSGPYARDRGTGYATTFSRPAIAMYAPPGAKISGFTVTPAGRASGRAIGYASDKGMRLARAGRVNLPRGGSIATTIAYVTRPLTTDVYRLRIASQPTLTPATVNVSVQLPTGWTGTPTTGWTQQGDLWTTTLTLTGDVDIQLPFTRG
ncbi:MAG: DUF4012 domain-containing protein [Mycobacteriales bacterium]